MHDSPLKLAKPPIVEAVVDIDCDLPPEFNLPGYENQARELFCGEYPNFRTRFIHEHQIEHQGDAPPKLSARRGVQAFQFVSADERQITQVRLQGFSFNRLAPYSSLDDYLPEIERTWKLFLKLTAPVQIRLIRLRYINRILLPTSEGRVDLELYLKVSPRLADQERLTFLGFLDRHAVLEVATGNRANIILNMQPVENSFLPLIFDIETVRLGPADPADWDWIYSGLMSLRSLKNLIFHKTLTDKCLSLFQQ